jgi:hypothetical protein
MPHRLPLQRATFTFTSAGPGDIKFPAGFGVEERRMAGGKPGHWMMKTKRRTVLIAAILTVTLFAAAILAIGLRRPPEKTLLKIMSDRVDLQVKNVHFTEVGSSGMTLEIKADTARYQKKENLALFDQLTVQYPVPRYGNRGECGYRFGKWRPLYDGPASLPGCRKAN